VPSTLPNHFHNLILKFTRPTSWIEWVHSVLTLLVVASLLFSAGVELLGYSNSDIKNSPWLKALMTCAVLTMLVGAASLAIIGFTLSRIRSGGPRT